MRLGRARWMDAEACGAIQSADQRVAAPVLSFDGSPDERLTASFDELGEAESTLELLAGLESREAELLGAIDDYVAMANPLADFPTVHLLRQARPEQEGRSPAWTSAPRSEGLTPPLREDEPDSARAGARDRETTPRRDPRFRTFNTSAKIDQYYKDGRGRSMSARSRSPTSGCGRWTFPSGWARSSHRRKIRPWEYHVDLAAS